MQKSFAIIGAYNSLAEGADPSLFEETYQVSWRPFLSTLYRFPDLCAALHYSGTVLAWLEAKHPEFLMLLEEMASRKQIELLGGGFFAPLIPLLPGQDRLGQIEMLTTYIRRGFGRRPRGCWVQDYDWEPGLASALKTCGFDFTFLPESQFRLAGLEPSIPVLTEDQGRSIAVFPVFDAVESLPELVPPDVALDSLHSKFPSWPLITLFYPGDASARLWASSGLESPDLLYERSFAAIQRNTSIETTTPSRFFKSASSMGRAYFAAGAAKLLMDRSLHPNSAQTALSVSTGSPRRLLLRYEESMALYAKMQYVRILVGQLRGDKARKKTAQEELWKGQCGEAYWYSASGGICSLAIRQAAYSSLIDAEKTMRMEGDFAPGIILADIDFDGQQEILYQSSAYNAYVRSRGGALVELDSFRSLNNYIDVLTEDGQTWPRRCFHDHIYAKGGFGPDLSAFPDTDYQCAASDRSANLAEFTCKCSTVQPEAGRDGAGQQELAITKSYSFKRTSITLNYCIANSDKTPQSFRLGVELNLTAGLSPDSIGLKGLRQDSEPLELGAAAESRSQSLSGVSFFNSRAKETLELRSDRPFELLVSPVFARVETAGVVKQLYQGERALLGYDMDIEPGASVSIQLVLELKNK